MDATELCYMPATELGVAIRSRRVSPVEVVDAILARIERLNPTLNAYCTITAAEARAAAKEAEAAVMRSDTLGMLHGIPVSIKDLIATKGVRTTPPSENMELRRQRNPAVTLNPSKANSSLICPWETNGTSRLPLTTRPLPCTVTSCSQ